METESGMFGDMFLSDGSLDVLTESFQVGAH